MKPVANLMLFLPLLCLQQLEITREAFRAGAIQARAGRGAAGALSAAVEEGEGRSPSSLA